MQATAICYYRRSRLPFARPQRPKTLRGSFDQAGRPQPSATIGVRSCRLPALKGLTRSAAASTGSFDQALRPQPSATIGIYRRSRLPFARPQRPKTLNAPRQHSATIGVRGCRLPALKGLKRSATASTRHAGHSHLLLSALEAAVCLPSIKGLKHSAAAWTGSFDQALRPQPSATISAIYRHSKLPFVRPQRPKTLRGSFDRQLLQGTQATAICYYRHLLAFEAAVSAPSNLSASTGSFDQAQPSAASGVRGCRLPALRLKGLKPCAAASTRHSGHSHLLLSAFEAAVCPPSKA